MAVGWSALGISNNEREMDNLDENLAWHEERQSDGQVVRSYSTTFPTVTLKF